MSLTELQKELHRTGIGSSKIAVIAGLSRYETAVDAYCGYLGLTEPFEGNRFTKWGERLEDDIADAYSERLGVELATVEPSRHPDHEWMIASPDRLWVDGSRIVECKTASARIAHQWGEEGTDEVPEAYLVQVAWQMAVTGIETADVAVLIGGNDFRIYTVHRDRELEAGLVEIGRNFWFNHVLAEVPPPVDGSEASARVLAARYPADDGSSLDATPDVEEWVEKLEIARRTIEDAAALKLEAENHVKAFMGTASELRCRRGRVTYRKAKDTPVTDWKSLATELTPSPALVRKHTTVREGSRRFLVKLEGER